jgi:hypothetical protein
MRTFTYFVNPFLLAALMSFKKAVAISAKTDDELFARTGIPFYAAQYALYHPLHQALMTAYNKWKADGGSQKSATALVDAIVATLTAKANAWDSQVQGVFEKGTPGYIGIFPDGHAPIIKGSVIERLSALEQLSLHLPLALAATKADVDGTYTTLDNARVAQDGWKGNVSTDSHALETQIIKTMNGLFGFYGNCIASNPADPTGFEPLFALNLVRDPKQTEFINHVAALKHKYIFKRTMPLTTMIKTINTGVVAADFGFAHRKTDAPGAVKITLAPGADTTQPASAYGYTADNQNLFFCVSNSDAVNEANFEIDIL